VLSSMVLLTDRDGHVGHIQFSAAAEASATATNRLELLQAGDVGATSGRTVAASHLLAADLWSLEQAAADLHDVGLARRAAINARRVAGELAPSVGGPADGHNETGKAESSDVSSKPTSVVQPPRPDTATQRPSDSAPANQPAAVAALPNPEAVRPASAVPASSTTTAKTTTSSVPPAVQSATVAVAPAVQSPTVSVSTTVQSTTSSGKDKSLR
jgi:hypothetical protein